MNEQNNQSRYLAGFPIVNEQPKTEEENYPHLTKLSSDYKRSEALKKDVGLYLNQNDGGYDNVNQAFGCGAEFGAHWQQSDPAFIADIVRQTLEYVAENYRNLTDEFGYFESYDRDGILAMHPEIVNQIIKKK